MRVALNTQYGVFEMSGRALTRLHKLGMAGIAVPVEEYFLDDPIRRTKCAAEWRERGSTSAQWGETIAFTPDESQVLHTPPLGGADLCTFRTHPLLLQVIDELGEAASGPYSQLKIVEIPDGILWKIVDHDGREHVAEAHRTWG